MALWLQISYSGVTPFLNINMVKTEGLIVDFSESSNIPVQLGSEFPYRQATEGQDKQQCILHHHPEHWFPQGYVLSPLLYTLTATWLQSSLQEQRCGEVCRSHSNDRTHPQQVPDGIQTGGGGPDNLFLNT